MARKTKYSKELIDEICGYIQDGLPNKDAAGLAGIGETTFYEWLSNSYGNPLTENEKAEFRESMENSQLMRKKVLTSRIIGASGANWRAGAWYLERVYPKEFGRDSSEYMGGVVPKEEEVSPLLVNAYNQAVEWIATGKMPHHNAFSLCLNDALYLDASFQVQLL